MTSGNGAQKHRRERSSGPAQGRATTSGTSNPGTPPRQPSGSTTRTGSSVAKEPSTLPAALTATTTEPPSTPVTRSFPWKALGYWAAIISAIAAVAALVPAFAGMHKDGSPSGGGQASTSASSSAKTPSTTMSSSPTGAAAETCFSAPQHAVPCDEIHSYEVMGPQSPCSREGAVAFMGGKVGLDVVSVRTEQSAGWKQCVLVYPKPARGSAKDVLAGNASARWRQCLDASRGTSGTLVTCDEPHNVEFLSTGARGQATTALCEKRAADYMGRSWSDVSDVLQVQFVKDDAPDLVSPRCALSPRQPDGRLGILLRRLRQRQVVVV